MIRFKLSKYIMVTGIVYLAIISLFTFDCRTFFVGIFPLNVVTSCVFVTLLIGLFLTFSSFHVNRLNAFRYSSVDIVLLLFLLLYGIKIGFNIYIEQIEQTNFNNRITFIPYYLLMCVLPYLLCRNIDWSKVSMYRLLWICYLFFLLSLLLSFQSIIALIAAGETAFQGRFQGNDFLDTIGYGHMGLTFVLVCISLWGGSNIKIRFILILSILFGLFSMGMANSRSPFVALFIILSIVAFVKMSHKIVFLVVSFILVIGVNIDVIDYFFKEYLQSQVVERVMTIFEFSMDSSSGRDELYKDGIHMFLSNPILGDAIVLTEGSEKGTYVHNAIIEAFMGLGFLGGVLYIMINVIIFKYSLALLKHKEYCFFFFLFMQYFIYLQFSRSMLLLPLYWATIGSISALNNMRIK